MLNRNVSVFQILNSFQRIAIRMGSKLVNNHYQMFFNQFQQTPGGGGGGNQFLPNPMLKIPSDMLDELIRCSLQI